MKWTRLLLHILIFCDFFSFIFKKDFVFIEEGEKSSENVAKVEEDVEGFDRDDIGNLDDLSTLVLWIKNVGILKSLLILGTLLEILTKKEKQDVLQVYRFQLCYKCCRQEYIFNNLVNMMDQLGKHDVSWF